MVKHMSKELTAKQSQSLNFAERDRITRDGGQIGEITADPAEVDGIIELVLVILIIILASLGF